MAFTLLGHFALDQNASSNTPAIGYVMIVFACLFIAGFAMTWRPIVWALVSEIYPSLPRQMHGASHNIQLGMELPHQFLHSIYYQHYRLPIRIHIRSLLLYGCVSGLFLRARARTGHWKRLIQCTSWALIRLRASIGSRRRVRTCRAWITRTSRLVLEVLRRMKPACLQKRDARVRGRGVAIFSKLPGRDSRVVIELLGATTFTVHAKVAGSVAFLAYIGVMSLPVIPCTCLSAGEFSLGH